MQPLNGYGYVDQGTKHEVKSEI